jgi:16S rRNA processing protein RimM
LPASYDPETLPVGVLGRPHGLRGEITLRPHNVAGSDLGLVTELILDRGAARQGPGPGVRPGGQERAQRQAPEVRQLQSIRPAGDGWLVKFVGVDTRTDAESLTNVPVRVRRRALPPLEAGEFYVADTVGCDVFTEDGQRLGAVADTFWNGAHDVLLVKREGEDELMIPALADFVRAVDVAARKVIVDWHGEDEVGPRDDGAPGGSGGAAGTDQGGGQGGQA